MMSPPLTLAEQDALATRTLAQLTYTPHRVSGRTCEICTEPVYSGDSKCHVCRDRLAGWGAENLADFVVPLTYASDTETPQIRRSLAVYKDGWDEEERNRAFAPLTYLLWQFIYRHGQCVESVLGGSVGGYVMVPSGSVAGRLGGHPMEGFEKYLPWERVHVRRTFDSTSRSMRPDTLEFLDPTQVAGCRFVVFDDTWTTGAAAQSVASALKSHGAQAVAIVVLGRWVNSSWSPVASFFTSNPRSSRHSNSCPVTGGTCPP